MDLDFLKSVQYCRLALVFRTIAPSTLPLFSGSALRGMICERLISRLCMRRGGCRESCADPQLCLARHFFSEPTATSEPSTKLWVLEPPIPSELEEIVHGEKVRFPYACFPPKRRGEAPILSSLVAISMESGVSFQLRLALMGPACDSALQVIEALAAAPLVRSKAKAPGSFLLEHVYDIESGGKILLDQEPPASSILPATVRTLDLPLRQILRAKTIRVWWLTPLRLRLDDGYCYNPWQVAEHFPAACWARCVRAYQACFPDGDRPPFVVLKPGAWSVRAVHAYRYELKRESVRQGREMSFDGLVGHFDISGDLDEVHRLARVAEIIHVGQKTTFGLGKIRVDVLE